MYLFLKKGHYECIFFFKKEVIIFIIIHIILDIKK